MTSWTRSFPPGRPTQSCWASTCWKLPMNLDQGRHIVSGVVTVTDIVPVNEPLCTTWCVIVMQWQAERAQSTFAETNEKHFFCYECHPKLKTSLHIFFQTQAAVLQTTSCVLFLVVCLLYMELTVCIVPLVGSTLITVGEYQKRLGGAEREFLQTSAAAFLTPLRNFLEGDWRTISVSLTYFTLSHIVCY